MKEWSLAHRGDLEANWRRVEAGEPLERIPPLERDYFARFFVDGDTVGWPNGADIAPETLHQRAKASAAASGSGCERNTPLWTNSA